MGSENLFSTYAEGEVVKTLTLFAKAYAQHVANETETLRFQREQFEAFKPGMK